MMRLIYRGFVGILLAGWALAACSPDEQQPAMGTLRVKIMTFNLAKGGDVSLNQVADAIRASGADIVGLQETDGSERQIADLLGWKFVDEHLDIISHLPLYRAARDGADFAYAEVAPGQAVAIANARLVPDPDRVEIWQSGAAEHTAQRKAMARHKNLARFAWLLPALAAEKMPVFLVGEFTAPSHLDAGEAALANTDPLDGADSKLLVGAGLVDSFRALRPDPAADPGFTSGTRQDQAAARLDFIYAGGPAKPVESKLVGGAEQAASVDISLDSWPVDRRSVVSTFDVTPATLPDLVIVEPMRVVVGEAFNVRIVTLRRAELGNIQIASADSRDNAPAIISLPLQADDQPAVSFGTARLKAGRYVAHVTDKAGRQLASTEFRVTRPAASPHIQIGGDGFNPGDPIELSWRGAPGRKRDWIGIYPAHEPNPHAYLGRISTDAAINGRAIFQSAESSPLPPGKYEARLMRDGSLVEVAFRAFLILDPHAKPQVAMASPTTRFGEAIEVSWQDSPGNDKDWIGLYRADESDLRNYLTYLYTKGEIDGQVSFSATGKFDGAPGAYVARLMVNDGYKELASHRFWITGADAKPQLMLARPQVWSGDPVEIHWMSAPAGEPSWISLYNAEDTTYAEALAKLPVTLTEGSITLSATDFIGPLEPGTYKVRLTHADPSRELASAEFSVRDPKAGPQIAIGTTPVVFGGPVKVSWKNSPGNRRDWIGLYKASETDPHHYITYLHTDGAIDGEVTFPPETASRKLPPGEYRASLLLDNGYEVVISAPFVVTAP